MENVIVKMNWNTYYQIIESCVSVGRLRERVGLEIRRPKYFFKKQIDKGILPKYVNMEQL